MQEKKSICDDKTLVIDINLTRGVVLVMVVILATGILFAGFGFYRDRAQAASISESTSGMRHYYLTKTSEWGSTAIAACEAGYHMASLWEIADPSNLKYDTTNGFQRPDSGDGPPAGAQGWVRTGYANDHSTTPGKANCDGWTNSSGTAYGTRAQLPVNWTAGNDDLSVWELSAYECGIEQYVWCVED